MNSQEYYDFIAKFEKRKTSDDCYTPPVVYDAVADYAEKRYNLNKDDFVRPFIPDGDYMSFNYLPQHIVVDNPPFSILSKIIAFYLEKGIKFFLFAPNKSILNFLAKNRRVTAICASANVIYDNGAEIKTSFVTNLEESIAARSCPELYLAIKEAQQNNKPKMKVYSYPDEVMTFSKINQLSENGVHFEIKRKTCVFIRDLDAQKESKTKIYGAGLLLSKDATRAYQQAKDCCLSNSFAATKRCAWTLSDREKQIVDTL